MLRSIYIGTSLHNHQAAKSLMDYFRAAGVCITYDWTVHIGKHYNNEDFVKIGIAEFEGVCHADLFFMLQPGRTGTHVELGVALALNKPIILLEDGLSERKPFYYINKVQRFTDRDQAITAAFDVLKKLTEEKSDHERRHLQSTGNRCTTNQ